jgi:hypothetical protein
MSTSSGKRTNLPQPSPEELDAAVQASLGTADAGAAQSLQNLRLIHEARLSQLRRTAATLKQEGASEADIKAADAAVHIGTARVASISAVHQQATSPAPQVSATGWALYGRILSSSLKPVPHLTVFLTDANKTYQRNFGFSYTDATGQYVISYAGDEGPAQSKKSHQASTESSDLQLFVGIVNASGKPIYPVPNTPTDPFIPVPGTATYRDILLPSGEQPVGDPPDFIREIALPARKKKR